MNHARQRARAIAKQMARRPRAPIGPSLEVQAQIRARRNLAQTQAVPRTLAGRLSLVEMLLDLPDGRGVAPPGALL